jgi:hypothetical protein
MLASIFVISSLHFLRTRISTFGFLFCFLAALRTLIPTKFDLTTVSSISQALVQFTDSKTTSVGRVPLMEEAFPGGFYIFPCDVTPNCYGSFVCICGAQLHIHWG